MLILHASLCCSGTCSNTDSQKQDTPMSSDSPHKQSGNYNECEKALLNGQNDPHNLYKKPAKSEYKTTTIYTMKPLEN